MGFFHRINQYLQAVKTELFGVDGEEYIDRYLSREEQRLWKRQTAPDRAHSLRVAQTADRLQRSSPVRISPEDRAALLKAALLHDLGRGEFGSSLAKSLAVLLPLWNRDKYRFAADEAAIRRLGRAKPDAGEVARRLGASGKDSGAGNKKQDAGRRPETAGNFWEESWFARLMYHYYYHPEIGAERLLELYGKGGRPVSGQQARIVWLVRHHRDDTAGNDVLLKLLMEADRQN